MDNFIKINGVALPMPSRGLNVEREQIVDSGRNANAQVVAQKINRRLIKFNELVWAHLTAQQWHDILVEIEKFEGELYYWDNLSQSFKTIRVYWGNSSETIWKINPQTGEVLEYVDCRCNIIDMGY